MVESRAVPENTAPVPENAADVSEGAAAAPENAAPVPQETVSEETASPGEGHALGHGNSVAAWTAVVVILVGALVAALGVIFTSVWLFVFGAVVVGLGAVTGKLLSAMGFGAPH